MWQVIGQDKILALLKRSLKERNIAHAYLFVGPHHVGKRTLALNLAQALNCDDLEQPPCGQCRSCLRIAAGKHADVIFSGLDSKTEIGIDDMRELQRAANLPPYEGKSKVLIIDDAEYMSSEAANSLLKTLEEPPPSITWLLLASEERRLLPTIISRCQRLELKPVPLEQTRQILTQRYKADPDKAELLARISHGCFGWALSALANEEILKQRSLRIDKLSSLLTANLQQRFVYAQELATKFSQERRSIAEILETWLDWWHDLMLVKGNCRDGITNIDYEMTLREQAAMLTLSEIKDFLSNLRLVNEEIFKNVNPRLAFEWLMLNLPKKEVVNG